MKRTVCLVTNWYPTNNNPYKGNFFKEQAFAVGDFLDFIIIHYREERTYSLKEHYSIIDIKEERNTKEYTIIIKYPFFKKMINYISCIFAIMLLKKRNDYIYSKKIKTYKKLMQKIYNEKFNNEFDVLYCVDAQNEAYIIEHISKISKKPYIVGEHAPVPWLDSHVMEVNKKAISNANLFLAISKDKIRQLMINNIKMPEIKYIGNLIDENKFTINNKHNSIKTIVIVAAYSHYKNYDLFIKTINRLTEITKDDFKVKIVGYNANKGYSKNVEELEKKILNSKFASKTILIPEIEHNKIADIYNSSDVFVMTSCQEGQPVSALEAACCGLPIYSTRCGGVEDYVTNEIGRLYNVNDYEELAEGLKDFIEGKVIYDSSKIRKCIINKYGTEAFIKNFIDAVNIVVERI